MKPSRSGFRPRHAPWVAAFLFATAQRLARLSMSRTLAAVLWTLGGCALAPAYADTFTVNDGSDGTTAGGCDSDCTLKDAIAAAGEIDGLDRIEFNVPPGTFFEFFAAFNSPVEVDGYSQDGSKVNTLDEGSNAEFGIRVRGDWQFVPGSDDSIVRGIEFFDVTSSRSSLDIRSANVSVLGCLFFDFVASASGRIFATNSVNIGSASLADRNQFISRTSDAITLGKDLALGTDASNSRVVNNIFGRSADLSGITFGRTAVFVDAGLSNIMIGGIGENEGNIFSGARRGAVTLGTVLPSEPPIHSQGVRIRGNRFVDNDVGEIDNRFGMAIDLSDGQTGVTPNDDNDSDIGPNGLQNFPVLTAAEFIGNVLRVSGTLDRPSDSGSRSYVIDFYANATCHPSGHGEGDLFVASSVFVSTGPTVESFTFNLRSSAVPQDAVLTATATEVSTGNTSEFSKCLVVTGTAPQPLPELIFADGFEAPP